MRTAKEFWARVEQVSKDACWHWTGATNNSGYGSVCWFGVTVTAHRLAAYLRGIVESPLAPKDRRGDGFILHQCDNPRCCNPKHFKVGTYKQNQQEAYGRQRREAFKGELHANSRLTSEQVKRIRKEYHGGNKTQTNLAAQYRVSQSCISKLVRGETY